MVLKLGLLISDDPDDYPIFYEAFDEIAKDVVILNVGNNEKAIRYLEGNDRKPDFLIIDLSMPGEETEQVFKAIRSAPALAAIPKLALVDHGPVSTPDTQVVFINKSADFVDLKKALRKLFAG